jgi:hypothetical protein
MKESQNKNLELEPDNNYSIFWCCRELYKNQNQQIMRFCINGSNVPLFSWMQFHREYRFFIWTFVSNLLDSYNRIWRHSDGYIGFIRWQMCVFMQFSILYWPENYKLMNSVIEYRKQNHIFVWEMSVFCKLFSNYYIVFGFIWNLTQIVILNKFLYDLLLNYDNINFIMNISILKLVLNTYHNLYVKHMRRILRIILFFWTKRNWFLFSRLFCT